MREIQNKFIFFRNGNVESNKVALSANVIYRLPPLTSTDEIYFGNSISSRIKVGGHIRRTFNISNQSTQSIHKPSNLYPYLHLTHSNQRSCLSSVSAEIVIMTQYLQSSKKFRGSKRTFQSYCLEQHSISTYELILEDLRKNIIGQLDLLFNKEERALSHIVATVLGWIGRCDNRHNMLTVICI